MGDSTPFTSDALLRKQSRQNMAAVEQNNAAEGFKKRMMSEKKTKKAKSAAMLKQHTKKPAKGGETVKQLKARIRTHNKRHCLKLTGTKTVLKNRIAHAKA
jgi:hypothetical protein